MDTNIQFYYRDNACSCSIYLDTTPESRFLFIELIDTHLIKKFGTYITIETDFEQCLPRKDDHDELVALRHAIFSGLKAQRARPGQSNVAAMVQ